MNLLVLMYHRARAGRHGNSSAALDAHFAHIARHYTVVLPGDKLQADRLNVCLSFDDGYFDFHAVVFPLLVRHNLKALLAIPPMHVNTDTAATKPERMSVESDAAFAHPELGGFCTWPEVGEMAASGHVTIAAHGLTHRRLDGNDANLEAEIDAAGALLRSRVAQPVDSFVFPFGRYSPLSLQRAKIEYRYVFRIGGALNRHWDQRILYRVDADEMESSDSLFSPARMASYRARYWWNRLRGR